MTCYYWPQLNIICKIFNMHVSPFCLHDLDLFLWSWHAFIMQTINTHPLVSRIYFHDIGPTFPKYYFHQTCKSTNSDLILLELMCWPTSVTLTYFHDSYLYQILAFSKLTNPHFNPFFLCDFTSICYFNPILTSFFFSFFFFQYVYIYKFIFYQFFLGNRN